MNIVIAGLLILTGITAYAVVNHLSITLHRPSDRTHVYFAGICLGVIGFALAQIATYQAQSVLVYITALKWNIGFILFAFMLFPWFIASFTQIRPIPLLSTFSVIAFCLSLINIFQPYSIQYTEAPKLQFLHLPWGEVITQPAGRNGLLFLSTVAMVLANFTFAIFALIKAWRRNHAYTTLAVLLAIIFFLATAMQGILVRSNAVDFVHLGPIGFLVMVIVMSVALSQHTRNQLHDSERRFRSLVEQSPFSIQVLTPNGNTRQVNPAWEKLWGVNADAIAPYNILTDEQLIGKGVMPYIEQGFAGTPTEIPPIVYNPAENLLVTGPLRDRWVRAFIYPIKDESSAVSDVILMHEDVTDRKRVEDAIRLIAAGVSSVTGAEFFQQLVLNLARVFDADYAFIGVLDDSGEEITTLAVSNHGQTVPGMSYALAGTPCANVVEQKVCIYPRNVQQQFPNDRLLADMGVEGYIGIPLADAQGNTLGLIVVLDSKPLLNIQSMQDILEIFAARAAAELQRQRAEARIRQMAYQDYLTGLASRARLHEYLYEVLIKIRSIGGHGALILIDLDHFKTINDALGHDIGDRVLQAVAQRLNEVTNGRALLSRIGGDEFVALMSVDNSELQEAETKAQVLAREIQTSLSAPINIQERAFSIGASIGVALFPLDDENQHDIMRHADMALYRAKNLGRGLIQFYLPELQAFATHRLHLEEGLRQAIAKNQLELYFQPQVNESNMIIGAEALLRWHHPELGNIPPDSFIPIAEETGFIHDIGAWVFDQACSALTHWLVHGAAFYGSLSINVCPWQFARPDFVDQVHRILNSRQIDARHLMIELTESALLYDIQEAILKLKALRALGLKIALDDFGTGYSSLAYLRDLPIDQIKIDKTFVHELNHSIKHPLVESMIDIGRHMQLAVVAEGVETELQREELIRLGCKRFQGYLFARPLPERDFREWLSACTAPSMKNSESP